MQRHFCCFQLGQLSMRRRISSCFCREVLLQWGKPHPAFTGLCQSSTSQSQVYLSESKCFLTDKNSSFRSFLYCVLCKEFTKALITHSVSCGTPESFDTFIDPLPLFECEIYEMVYLHFYQTWFSSY